MQTKIIYEDDTLLVVYKPAGLAVQSARVTQTDVVSELNNYLAGQNADSRVFLGLVHRLDQPVEGLLVFAKNEKAAADLSAQLGKEYKSCQKIYKTVVCFENPGYTDKTGQNQADILQKEPFILTDYLIKDNQTRLAKIVTKDTPQAKKATLSYEILSQKETLALLKIHLETGRFHQIRAQLSHAGMPILGDLKYGTANSREISQKNHVRTVALCAEELRFIHPKTGKPVMYKAAPQNKIFEVFNS